MMPGFLKTPIDQIYGRRIGVTEPSGGVLAVFTTVKTGVFEIDSIGLSYIII